MRLASVLNYLRGDIALTTILEDKREHPKITAYKAHDKNTYPYITVKLEPFTTDSVVSQYICEVRVVTDDALLVEDLTNQVINMLHFDNRPTVKQDNNLIFTSIHNGGTLHVDEEKGIYSQVLIFNIKFNRK